MEAGPSNTSSPLSEQELQRLVPQVTLTLIHPIPLVKANTSQKRFYRQRAHANVFIDHILDYPPSPYDMDWSTHYPKYFEAKEEGGSVSTPAGNGREVEWADVGCGFGGLLMALAPQFPDTLMLGETTFYVRPP